AGRAAGCDVAPGPGPDRAVGAGRRRQPEHGCQEGDPGPPAPGVPAHRGPEPGPTAPGLHRSRFHHLVLVLRFSARSGGWQILAESELTLQEEIYFVE